MSTLGAVYDKHTTLGSISELIQQVGSVGGEVSSSISLEDHALRWCLQVHLNSFQCDGRENAEKAYVPIQICVQAEWRDIPWAPDVTVVNLDVDAHGGQGREVWRVKGIKAVRANLGHSVSPEELVSKVYRYFRNVVVSCENKCSKKVISSVRSRLKEWNLGASDDHSLSQMLHHEGESRSRVGHGVRPMKDNESVKEFIIVL